MGTTMSTIILYIYMFIFFFIYIYIYSEEANNSVYIYIYIPKKQTIQSIIRVKNHFKLKTTHMNTLSFLINLFSNPLLQSFNFLFIIQFFSLCYSFTASEDFEMNYSNERVKFSNLQHYWYFYIMGWGRLGRPVLHPPQKCSEFSI